MHDKCASCSVTFFHWCDQANHYLANPSHLPERHGVPTTVLIGSRSRRKTKPPQLRRQTRVVSEEDIPKDPVSQNEDPIPEEGVEHIRDKEEG